MIDRVLVRLLAGCALFGGVIAVELAAPGAEVATTAPVAREPHPVAAPAGVQGPRNDELLTTILGRPLFSPTRQPPARPDQPTDAGLADVRLTGIVIEPDRHLAIFAMPGAKPIVRAEGGTVNDWRIDNIALDAVVLSGPTGSTTLQPKIDASLTRRAPAPPPPRLPAVAPPAGAAAPKPTASAAPAVMKPPGPAKRPGIAMPTPPGMRPPKPALAPAAAAPEAPPQPRPPGPERRQE